MAWRRRRRSRRGSLSTTMRRYVLAVLFLAFAGVTIAATTFLLNIIPSQYIVITPNGISVDSTLPSGATGVDAKLVAALIGWSVGIFLLISAIRRFGLRI